MTKQFLRIEGGNPLCGSVAISGAKNAALPCLFATLLTDDDCVLDNIPKLGDVATAQRILNGLGRKSVLKRNKTQLSGRLKHGQVPPSDARAMRASILALGPLLARGQHATVPLPGGCDIGSRPIAVHLASLAKLGAKINLSGGVVEASVSGKGLRGARITLEFPSVTGTETAMLAATLARGETIIENVACEPEIVNLAQMLNSMGAKIEGAGNSKLQIEGVTELSGSLHHRIMGDRIEAGTYLTAVAATGGAIELLGANSDTLGAVLNKLEAMGVKLTFAADSIKAQVSGRLTAVGFETAPYPGFPTDLQAQLMAANCVADGQAMVVEHIFERRFRHADELALLGAKIEIHSNQALVKGVRKLQGAPVTATDLRASASLVIAGLAAQGTTLIGGLEHLERGYENLPGKLVKLGAVIKKV